MLNDAIRAYLRLSEDELEMRQKGWIGDGAYEIWRDGIRVQLTQSAFQRVWAAVGGEPEPPALRSAACSLARSSVK
jgi:hypothetical protein